MLSSEWPRRTRPLARCRPNGPWPMEISQRLSVNVMTPEIRAMYPQFQTEVHTTNQLLLNHTVRDAIAMSVNKTTVVEYALLGLGEKRTPWSRPQTRGTTPFQKANASSSTPQRHAPRKRSGLEVRLDGGSKPECNTPVTSEFSRPLRFRFFVAGLGPCVRGSRVNISAWLAETGIRTTDAPGNPGYRFLHTTRWLASGCWHYACGYGTDYSLPRGRYISLDILSSRRRWQSAP